ncbi:MAG: acylphosphatase [Candidatus Kerfeldbacteria bacterium]|nr:acylphosphatase [Candidatus Kerfeldbacteria bacterium]
MTCIVVVRGKVHGVGFRAAVREYAQAGHVTGTACNAPDRSVRIVISGEWESLQRCIGWCSRGPRGARVDSVTVQKVEEKQFDDFAIITYTG